MTDDTLILTFPKNKTEEITLQGLPFICVDTGMTIESFMLALMKYSASDKKGMGANLYAFCTCSSAWDQRGSSGICDAFEPRGKEE